MMDTARRRPVLFLLLLLNSLIGYALATVVSHDGRAITIDGKRRLLISGSIHYPRSTPEMWPDLIRKAKEGGLDTIETYVFWNAHEPRKREYNFQGNLDLVKFIKEIQSAGLYAFLRIGPYACAEWNYGGFPGWLHQIPGIKMRTDNKPFKDEMQNFTTYIVDMMKKENLFAPQGGPIILSQIENEYGNVNGPYGEAGKTYIKWCAEMAVAQNIGVPWVMCQQADAPQPMINTCNNFYCHKFQPNNPNSPKIWTENWSGWFKAWDKATPHRPAEDVAYAVARFFQTGGTLQNYYMYHGGTNFGHTAGGPYMVTSYDYDAILDEYGNLNQPKWGHLKELHAALRLIENALLNGTPNDTNLNNGISVTKYSAQGASACFLVNNNPSTDATASFEGGQYVVPAWSVSILPNCKNEVCNTAKVKTQATLMVMRPNKAENEPAQLIWTWKPENMKRQMKAKGTTTANELKEQLLVTGDTSDYLWYMTSANLTTKGQMTLRVNTSGHILHAFVNGRLVGSNYAPNGGFQFRFEKPVTVKPGQNFISLLSATMGLKNYGSYFDEVPTGINGGPVVLVGSDNSVTNLTTNTWSYQVGLRGFDSGLYMESPKRKRERFFANGLSVKRPFIWYKTTFKPPLGTDPVVVDLQGMGKGEAWVNGQSIGRYWPTYIATSGTCGTCDYRVKYNGDSTPCRTGCNQPSQRYYHVPRAWLREGQPNTLVLFEEAGGDPAQVNFQTVTVGAACASVPEGEKLTVSCQGSSSISDVQFASFGDPQGACGVLKGGEFTASTFQKGSCESATALNYVKTACVGKPTCTIDATEAVLGKADCNQKGKKLAVAITCS